MIEYIRIDVLMALLVSHFIGDFILQSDRLAINKSSSNSILFQHILMYSIPFLLFFNPIFVLFNAVLHFMTDYTTSRVAKGFRNRGDNHNFFITIGFDQFIHMVTLSLSYVILSEMYGSMFYYV